MIKKLYQKINPKIREWIPTGIVILLGITGLPPYFKFMNSIKTQDFRTTTKIENYEANLFKVPAYFQVNIEDTNKNVIIYSRDYNKDTIIDEITIRLAKPDKFIQNISSVKELSKIEKKLLEK